MENDNQCKAVNVVNASVKNSAEKKLVKNDTNQSSGLYSKKYYTMFFSIMIVTFLLVFWLCNYTKLKEMFQILTLMAFSIALAEYLTRRFLGE